MALTDRQKLGLRGERKAVRYLKRNGYKILERNFKCRFGEADIIAKKGDTVAFIEVKTRDSDIFGAPREAVTPEKQKRYISIANYYFANCILQFTLVRFDVIEIYKKQITHIENAFY